MNEICKTSIAQKLEKAMATESYSPSQVAKIFGFPASYISMVRNIKSWNKCPNSAWEAILLWINSGQTLRQYSDNHHVSLPENNNHTTLIDVTKGKIDISEIKKGEVQVQKVLIEIEINLIVKGKKIQL